MDEANAGRLRPTDGKTLRERLVCHKSFDHKPVYTAPNGGVPQGIVEKPSSSRASVSLALHDLGTLSDRTRAKIRQTAEEMDYRPNPLMSVFSRR